MKAFEYTALRLHSTGEDVERLQQALIAKGYDLGRAGADGDFGRMTEAAVRKYQQDNNLVADGVAGNRTLTHLYQGSCDKRFLCQSEIVQAAQILDVDVALIQALAEKESGRSGFFSNGHPSILFERHIMYRRLAIHGLSAANLAKSHPHLVNTQRGGYRGMEAECDRLLEAKLLHVESAIESASWGRFQIMGFHWRKLGYLSPQEFERRMGFSEGEQLIAVVRFIKADNTLHKAFRDANYQTIAEIYNGPAYRENNYDVDLARLHEKHRTANLAAA